MYDFHSQILSNQSNKMDLAKAASQAGFKNILATPNFAYQEDSVPTYEAHHNKYIEIRKELKQNNIDIEIYMGNEISYSKEIIDLLKTSNIHTINNTNYVLLKFDIIESNFYSMIDAAFLLQIKGYRPIISQIEKYDCIIHDLNIVRDLNERDVLTQLDILSITGAYGGKIKKTAKSLLKNNLIHTLGTNINEAKEYIQITKALTKIKRIVGKTKFKEITTTNGEYIINNKQLQVSDTVRVNHNIYKHCNNN